MDSEGKDLDRLSSLPSSLLVHILSFLPARDAARTVLIRCFGDLWKNIHDLYFDHLELLKEKTNILNESASGSKFIHYINNFLQLHKSPRIGSFCVRFSCTLACMVTHTQIDHYYVSEVEERKLANEMEMWIKYALGKEVEILGFRLGTNCHYCEERKSFLLPHSVWSSHSVAQLYLCHCDIGSPKQVSMHSLKVLDLERVSLGNDVFSQIISGCSSLQHVVVTDCAELTELSFTDPNVEKLEVYMDYEIKWEVVVKCPNVKSFHYIGFVNHVKLIDLSSVKLVSLGININRDESSENYLQLKVCLERIQHADILKLNTDAFAVLTYLWVNNHPCPSNKWKRVILDTWLNRKYISGICNLLRNSPHLEELTINIVERSTTLTKELHDSGKLDDSEWSSEYLMQNLKNITINGLFRSSTVMQIELVKVILKNALILEKLCMVAKVKNQPLQEEVFTFDELSIISEELIAFPKASKKAVVSLKLIGN